MMNQALNVLHRSFVQHPKFPERDSTYIRWYPKSLSIAPPQEALGLERATPRGAYIHVPFCDRLCRFCPFNKRETDVALLQRFVLGLKMEIALYANMIGRAPLEFVYFGGGTPSVLSVRDISEVVECLDSRFGLAPDAEVTLESHPSHISSEFLSAVSFAGITRISSGFQAFDDDSLLGLGAQHRVEDIDRALRAVNSCDIAFGIDLLFRCTGQDTQHWRRQLERVVELERVSHLSCYSLILKNDRQQPSTDVEAEMTLAIDDTLGPAGFKHYASCASGGLDYARDSAQCKYEVCHWGAPQAEFLGLGPGAFGYLAHRTTVNGLDIHGYANRLSAGRLPLASAVQADCDELMRRYFVLGVKTLRVPLEPFEVTFGLDPRDVFAREFDQLSSWGFAHVMDNAFVLTTLGRLFVDTISAVFFSPTELDVSHPEEPEIRRVEVASTQS